MIGSLLSTASGISPTGGPSAAGGGTIGGVTFGDKNLGAGAGPGNPAAGPAGVLASVPVWAWLAVGLAAIATVFALLWSPKPKKRAKSDRRP